jgi:hypothetical protein
MQGSFLTMILISSFVKIWSARRSSLLLQSVRA